jgi:hypothetical protein
MYNKYLRTEVHRFPQAAKHFAAPPPIDPDQRATVRDGAYECDSG